MFQSTRYANITVIALSILDKLVTTRWRALPKEQSQGIRNYIVSVMIKTSSNETTMIKERTYLNKLNLTLVAVSCYQYWQLLISDFKARLAKKLADFHPRNSASFENESVALRE